MTTQEFLDEMATGNRVVCGSPIHQKMSELSQDAIKITMQINNAYTHQKKSEPCSPN